MTALCCLCRSQPGGPRLATSHLHRCLGHRHPHARPSAWPLHAAESPLQCVVGAGGPLTADLPGEQHLQRLAWQCQHGRTGCDAAKAWLLLSVESPAVGHVCRPALPARVGSLARRVGGRLLESEQHREHLFLQHCHQPQRQQQPPAGVAACLGCPAGGAVPRLPQHC